MRRLKVYQGSFDGRHTFCVATTSYNQVFAIAKLCGQPVSLGYLRSYWTVTGNKSQIEAAMRYPDTMMRESAPNSGDYLPVAAIARATGAA